MKLILVFYKKNGQHDATEVFFTNAVTKDSIEWAGPIPRVKESVYCDEEHKGIVFNVLFNFNQKTVYVKIR